MDTYATALIERAKGLGIRLVPKGGRIQFSPREAMPADLLAALRASRDEVLRELARPGLGTETPRFATDTTDRTPMSPTRRVEPRLADVETPEDATDTTDRRVESEIEPDLLSVLSVPIEEVLVALRGRVEGPDLGTPPGRPCRACRQTSRWRLEPGAAWVCPTCHPPLRPGSVEWQERGAE